MAAFVTDKPVSVENIVKAYQRGIISHEEAIEVLGRKHGMTVGQAHVAMTGEAGVKFRGKVYLAVFHVLDAIEGIDGETAGRIASQAADTAVKELAMS